MHAGECPVLAPDVTISPLDSVGGDRYVVHCNGHRYQVGPLLKGLVEAIDGQRDYESLARLLQATTKSPVTPEDVQVMVQRWLVPRGLAALPGTSFRELSAAPSSLTWKRPLIASQAVRKLSRPLTWLFHPVLFGVLLLIDLAVWLTLPARGFTWDSWLTLVEIRMVPLWLVLKICSAFWHEVGHAAACVRVGGRPGAIGVGVFLDRLVLYTDLNNAWTLPRNQRVLVDLGGVYFELVLACLVGVGVFASVPRMPMLFVMIHVFLLPNLHPFLKYDGYWLVSDALGVPNLHRRVMEVLSGLVGRRQANRYVDTLPGATRLAVQIYAGFCVLFVPLFLWFYMAPSRMLWTYYHTHWANSRSIQEFLASIVPMAAFSVLWCWLSVRWLSQALKWVLRHMK